MEYYSDEEDDGECCRPCYIFYESKDNLCELYKDRQFYGAEQFLSPSVTRAIRTCQKAFSRISENTNKQSDCCCRNRICAPLEITYCTQSKNEGCLCRRNYEGFSRIVEVADVCLSVPNFFAEDTGTILNNKNNEEECLCEDEYPPKANKESICEEKCPKHTISTAISGKELCTPCERQMNPDNGHKNININVKVKIRKKKKKKSSQGGEHEQCEGHVQGETHKEKKKKCKCEISKPIVICNKKPEPKTKLSRFLKCKKLVENIANEVELKCGCKKKREQNEDGKPEKNDEKSEKKRMSVSGNNIFIPTTKPLDPEILSTILEESMISMNSSNDKRKNTNGGHRRTRKPQNTKKEKRKLSYLESEEMNGKVISYIKCDKMKKRNPVVSESTKGNGTPHHREKNDKVLMKKDKRKNRLFESSPNHGGRIDILERSGRSSFMNPSPKNYEIFGGTDGKTSSRISDMLHLYINENEENYSTPPHETFINRDKAVNYLFVEQTQTYFYSRWYYEKVECCSKIKTENLVRFERTTQLTTININEKTNICHPETTQWLRNVGNLGRVENTCSTRSDFDYRQVYDLREIFKKFEVYKQQQNSMMQQEYEQECGKITNFKAFKKCKEPKYIQFLKILAVHVILFVYFVIFVWFTFFW